MQPPPTQLTIHWVKTPFHVRSLLLSQSSWFFWKGCHKFQKTEMAATRSSFWLEFLRLMPPSVNAVGASQTSSKWTSSTILFFHSWQLVLLVLTSANLYEHSLLYNAEICPNFTRRSWFESADVMSWMRWTPRWRLMKSWHFAAGLDVCTKRRIMAPMDDMFSENFLS